MEIKIILMGETGKEMELEKIVNKFKKDISNFAHNVTWKSLGQENGMEAFGIRAELTPAPPAANGDEERELSAALTKRLIVYGLEYGFRPLDNQGRLIYILPPYGFDVTFYSPQKGREQELFELVKIIYQELGEHVIDGHLGTRQHSHDNGEYYIVNLVLQDYLPEKDRHRLCLAAYFRLLALVKKHGFQVVIPVAVNPS